MNPNHSSMWGSQSWLPPPFRRRAGWKAGCGQDCPPHNQGPAYPRLVFFALLLLTLPLPAQDRHPITGRRYASVMGSAGADWLVRPERETEEQPDRALDLIGIVRNSTVADVGAGNGYIAWRLA